MHRYIRNESFGWISYIKSELIFADKITCIQNIFICTLNFCSAGEVNREALDNF
jgi:hypothetical protein